MIRNYFKSAWNSLLKTKFFSFINILGLAFGISLCMVIIAIVNDQLSYDAFHHHASRILRINTEALRKNGDTEKYASSPFPVGNLISKDYPSAEKVVSLTRGMSGDIHFEQKNIGAAGFFTDAEFFDVFGFTLKEGDAASVFSAPNSVVLTENLSVKIFGDADPVGKIITLKDVGDFTVTGILNPFPGKTHLDFEMLGSANSLPALEKAGKVFPVTSDWQNYYMTYNYVLLKEGEDPTAFEKQLEGVFKKYYGNLQLESRDKGYHFYLQSLAKIVPGPMLSNNLGKALPLQILWFLIAFASIVIISAGFNYSSLTIARSLNRAKEIGIRKSAGARKKQLIMQFLMESVFTSFLSFILGSFLFHFFLKPFFSQLNIAREFDFSLDESVSLYAIFCFFSVVVGLIAGILPAITLSSIDPVKALKDLSAYRLFPKWGWRKSLMVVQFTAALLFIITLINISRQISFVMNADYGFRKDNVLNVDLQQKDYESVRRQFAQCSGVTEVTAISHDMGTWADRTVDVRVKENDEKLAVRDYTIDDHYISSMDLSLVAGKDFTHDVPETRELFAIVNESFVKSFQLGTANEAIGKPLILNDSLHLTISGVVKDFHFKPFTYSIEPLILRYHPADLTKIYVQLSGKNNKAAITQMEAAWKSVAADTPFSWQFLDDELRASYSEFNDLSRLIFIVTFMSVTVACLGLLGLVILMLQQREKEIGIRKVLGASMAQLALLFSGNVSRLIVFALIAGLPLAILLNNLMLNIFAYRINPVWGFLAGTALILLITVLTMGSQIVRVMIANPLKSLRTE